MSRGLTTNPARRLTRLRALVLPTALCLVASIATTGIAYGATAGSENNPAVANGGSADTNDAHTFSNPGLRHLADDYRSHKLSSEQFVTYSLGTLFGVMLPQAYADGSVKTASGLSDADQTALLDYAFAVANTLPEPEKSQLANAFGPFTQVAHGSLPAIDPAPRPTRKSSSGAAPSPMAPELQPAARIGGGDSSVSTYCDEHLRIGLPPVLHIGFSLKPVTFRCGVRTPHFSIWFSLKSQDPQNGVDDTDVWGNVDSAGNSIPDGLPDYVNNVARSLEDAYDYYQGLGYTEPANPPIGVLVSAFNGQMNQGAAFTPPPIMHDQLIVMSNVGTEIYIPHHEVFHTFQYPYISDLRLIQDFGKMNWWMEATAEWAAHQSMSQSTSYWADAKGDSEEASYAQRLPDFLGTPALPLNYYAGLDGARQYGAFIFAEYLSEYLGDQVIRQSWQHIYGGAWPVDAISEALADNGSSFSEVLPDFAKAVYQLGPDSTGYWSCVPGAGPDDNPDGLTPPYCGQDTHAVYTQGTFGYGSDVRQFLPVSCPNDQCTDDLPAWIGYLGQDSRTNSSEPNDPARYAPRPAHEIIPAADPDTHTVSIGPGGMYFADLTGSFGDNQALQVTVNNPTFYGLHASLISWTRYHVRCGEDRDADVPGWGSVTLQGPALGGCAYSTLVLTDTTPFDGASYAPPATWSSQVITTGPARVLVFGNGDYGWSYPDDWATQTLTDAGYDVDESPGLPPDLSSYGAIFYIGTDPLTADEQTALADFTAAGGGLYVTGERPCCEALNASDTALLSQILTPQAANVQIGGLGDLYDATGALPVNTSAIDGLATTPNTTTSVTVSAPGGIAGVSGDNVLAATSLPNGTPIAAAWDGADVIGGGRAVVFMDINWLEPLWYGNTATATPLLENIATFLDGAPAFAPGPTPVPALRAAANSTHPTPPSAAQ